MTCWRATVLLGALLAARPAGALDWREPWVEPQDTAAAAARSDEYAWRLFVALNWPADPRRRSADRRAAFGTERPVVWETWADTGDVYLETGADPGPWRPGDPARAEAAERRFETYSLKDLRNARHIVDGVMVPLVDSLASARRLTEIRMNRPCFEYIRARELYRLDGQLRAYAAHDAVAFPFGAKEIKAKWRPIAASERARYHTTWVTLADGSKRLYGLTSLHVASKDLPHWFWATFEHVDNPRLADNEGWVLPSQDRFACGDARPDCNRAPSGIGLEGTVWQYYRLRGTLTDYTDAEGRPQRLANSELEAGMQTSASCMTCHARAALAVVGGEPVRLSVFDTAADDSAVAAFNRRGFIGKPLTQWFGAAGNGAHEPLFRPLDFVWSMAKAR